MKKIVLFGVVLAVMMVLQSHEFWLEPVKFKVKPGEELVVNFRVGENFTGQAWDLGKNRVEKMVLFEKGPMQDILSKVPSVKGEKMKVKLNNPGTKIIAMKSNAAFIELDAEKFNLYLKEDGLEEVYDWRVKNGQGSLGAKEFYTRYTKLIAQCGDQIDDTWKKQAGHRLEITPDSNPASLKAGDYMSCKVTYERKPAKHITVKVWGHVGNKIFLQNIYSEDDGSIKFPISASGPWMVSAVRMEKSRDPKVDWESSWATLIFNID